MKVSKFPCSSRIYSQTNASLVSLHVNYEKCECLCMRNAVCDKARDRCQQFSPLSITVSLSMSFDLFHFFLSVSIVFSLSLLLSPLLLSLFLCNVIFLSLFLAESVCMFERNFRLNDS